MHTGGVSLTAQIDLLRGAVDAAREAIVVDGGAPGDHVEVVVEDDNSAAHYFTADLPGYRGWRWCAVVALADADDRSPSARSSCCPATGRCSRRRGAVVRAYRRCSPATNSPPSPTIRAWCPIRSTAVTWKSSTPSWASGVGAC